MRPISIVPFLAAASALALAGCAATPRVERTDSHFYSIAAGMTLQEVEQMLGPPDFMMSFPRTRTVAWDYEYRDTWGYLSLMSVTFDADGRTVGKFRQRLRDKGGKGGNS